MDDNRKKLHIKHRLLWTRVAEKSDSNQVEFRRRIDLLAAVNSSLLPIWIAIHTESSELKVASKFRRLLIALAIFCLGALINWLFPSDGKPYIGFGVLLMFGACCSYLFRLIKLFMLENQIKKLHEQQSIYLFHWLGTGASNEDFWRCQRAVIRMNELEENLRDTDLLRSELLELEHTSENHLINMRHDILRRASGDYQGGWILDLDAINLPAEVGEQPQSLYQAR